MISVSPISVFEHSVGIPTPRLTIQPSSNRWAMRSAICWRVSPMLSLISMAPRPLRPPAFGRGWDAHDPADEHAGGVNLIGVDGADGQNILLDLGDGDPRGHRQHGVE